MTEQNEDTYAGWGIRGRVVLKGEKAAFYLRDPENPRAAGVPLFGIDQTAPYEAPSTEGLERVTAEEYQRGRARKQLKTIRIDYDGSAVLVWCGNDKEAIKYLRQKKFVFSLATHRWRRPKADPVAVAQHFAKDHHVETTGFLLDGEPVTLEAPRLELPPTVGQVQTAEEKRREGVIVRRDNWRAAHPQEPYPYRLTQDMLETEVEAI